MKINDTQIGADLLDILTELQAQMRINNLPYIKDIKDGPDNIQITCPYHNGGQERKPSMGVKKSTGVCHCFACGKVVDLPELISNCFNQDDMIGTFGWNWILKNFVTISVEERKDVTLDFYRGSKSNCSSNSFVSEEELDSYRYFHPYMYKRKLTDEIIEIFDIGYDKDSKCITFPVRDINGNTLFIARRSVVTKFFNYPQGVEKPVYGLYELEKIARKEFHCIDTHIIYGYPSEVIICESMLDCLYFWTIGKYAVALNGLGNELQFKQLNQMPCRKFILCTDSDEAGMKARKRIRANLKNKIITEYILPEGRKDANDCTVDELKSLQEVF